MKKNRLYEIIKYMNPNKGFEILKEYFEVGHMPNIPVDIPITNINSKVFNDIKIENDSVKVLDPDFKAYKKFDFILGVDGNLYLGNGHYKISHKAPSVKAAGEIMFDENGKIIYISNDSGHYRPSQKNLEDIAELFRKNRLLNPEYSIIHKKYNE